MCIHVHVVIGVICQPDVLATKSTISQQLSDHFCTPVVFVELKNTVRVLKSYCALERN